MHRSGTSLLTRILNLLGVNLGHNLLPPAKDNPKGFWENIKVVKLNEEILSILNFTYDDPRPLPSKWWKKNILLDSKQKIYHFIKTEFSSNNFLGIKDPRLCRLVPFWNLILEELGLEAHYILISRNPLEVADSLYKRDGIHRAKSFLLWLRYNLEAEYFTREKKRVFVRYENLLDDWGSVINRISTELDIDLYNHSLEQKKQIKEIINPNLRNHNYLEQDLSSNSICDSWIKEADTFLVSQSKYGDKSKINVLNSISNELKHMDNIIWKFIQGDIERLNAPLNKRITELELQQKQILESLSWKITQPLRQAKKILIK